MASTNGVVSATRRALVFTGTLHNDCEQRNSSLINTYYHDNGGDPMKRGRSLRLLWQRRSQSPLAGRLLISAASYCMPILGVYLFDVWHCKTHLRAGSFSSSICSSLWEVAQDDSASPGSIVSMSARGKYLRHVIMDPFRPSLSTIILNRTLIFRDR